MQCIVKGVMVSVVLGLVGYFLFPVIGLDAVSPQVLLAAGLVIGSFLGMAFVAQGGGHGTSASADDGEAKTIYVGNISFKATEEGLHDLFGKYGAVVSVRLVKDKYTGRARGFGFVEMAGKAAKKAVKGLDGADFEGRNLKVNFAKESRTAPAEKQD